MKTVIVNLVSDQTIPSLQFVKRYREESNDYLFLTTPLMNKKGVTENIIKACNFKQEDYYKQLEINPTSYAETMKTLKDNQLYKNTPVHFIVNLTGGTKIMALACLDYFRDLNADIKYISYENKIHNISPLPFSPGQDIEKAIELDEYLIAYGFNIKSEGSTSKPKDYTLKFFNHFNSFAEEDHQILQLMRSFRKTKNNSFAKIAEKGEISISQLEQFLSKIEFDIANEGKISKYEARYLSGDWLEEYVYYKLISDLQLKPDQIGKGYHLEKNGVQNEMDLLFIHNNKLYTIECKTFIEDEHGKTNIFVDKVLYKSASLQIEFGLYTNTSIATLSQIKDEEGNLLAKHKEWSKRASLYKIKMLSANDINPENNIAKSLGIKITEHAS
jgi:hypothetical protein